MRVVEVAVPAFVALGLAISSLGASAASLTDDQAASIDRAARAVLARDHIPAIGLAVARDGEIVYARGYGLRDVAHRKPADQETMFEIGSVTKQFTAASVMLFVQAGKIRLDAPIAAYLNGIPFGDRITVRELLTHTSGLANYTEGGSFLQLASKAVTPRDIVASIAKRALEFEPGTKWRYSNTNYAILGLLIEKESGMSYRRFVESRFFKPLGLSHTRYSDTYLTDGDDALPYFVEGDKPAPASGVNLSWAYAAGGLWSNAPDLVRWEYALFSGHVVSDASVAAMTTPAKLPNGTPTEYGFGFASSSLYGEPEIWHTGGLPGYGSEDAYFPNEHLEVAVLGNAMTLNGPEIVRDVLGALVPSVSEKIAAETSATSAPGEDLAITKLATTLLAQAQAGTPDRTLFTAEMNAGLTPDLVARVAHSLAPLGTPKSIAYVRMGVTPTYHGYRYRLVWDAVTLDEVIAIDANGKISGWLFQQPQAAPAASSSPSASATPSPSSSTIPSPPSPSPSASAT